MGQGLEELISYCSKIIYCKIDNLQVMDGYVLLSRIKYKCISSIFFISYSSKWLTEKSMTFQE